MIDVKIDPKAKPLPSDDLKHDAEEAGVEADQSTHKAGDPHLPASEGGSVPD